MKRLLALGLLLMSVCAQAQPRPVIKGRTPLTQLVKLETNLTRKIPLLRVSPLAPIPNAGNALLSPQMVHDQATKLLASASLETFPFKKSQIQPLEQHIHHFVFTIAPRDNPQQIVGTGFVFSQEEEQAPLRLWGATSAQVAQQAGEDVLITFQGLRSTTSFPAKIVFQGHPLGSNAALIEVPQEISQVAMPIPLADKQVIRPHQPLMAYGFDETGRFHKEELMSFVPGPERGLALPARPEEAAPLAGGFVTNRTGQALGIFTKILQPSNFPEDSWPEGGLYDTAQEKSQIIEFIPTRHLDYLLRAYQDPHSAERVILLKGTPIGTIALDEAIEKIKVYYPRQRSSEFLPYNPFWSLYNLDQFIPELDQASKIYIYISGGSQGNYYYVIDQIKGRIRKSTYRKEP